MRAMSIGGVLILLALLLALANGCNRRRVSCSGQDGGQYPHTLATAQIPKHGVICYQKQWLNSAGMYEYSVRWEVTPRNMQQFLVWRGGNPLSDNVEIRSTPDYSGIWIVARNEGEFRKDVYDRTAAHVLASLDMIKRVFVGENGFVMDPALPLAEQEKAAQTKDQLGHPRWATIGGGIILSKARAKN